MESCQKRNFDETKNRTSREALKVGAAHLSGKEIWVNYREAITIFVDNFCFTEPKKNHKGPSAVSESFWYPKTFIHQTGISRLLVKIFCLTEPRKLRKTTLWGFWEVECFQFQLHWKSIKYHKESRGGRESGHYVVLIKNDKRKGLQETAFSTKAPTKCDIYPVVGSHELSTLLVIETIFCWQTLEELKCTNLHQD